MRSRRGRNRRDVDTHAAMFIRAFARAMRHRCDDPVTADSCLVTYVVHLRHNESMQMPTFDDGQDFGDSMLEEIRRTAEQRLHQIEPLIEEAERLRDVLKVLGGHSARRGEPIESAAPLTEAPSAYRNRVRRAHEAESRSVTRNQARSGARAAKGSNKRAILELVADRPGITPAQISEATGMKRTVVASTVSRLKRHGELLDHESGGVCVPSGSAAARSSSRTDASAAGAQQTGRAAARPRPRRLSSLQARQAA
jgi:hypothetical protein